MKVEPHPVHVLVSRYAVFVVSPYKFHGIPMTPPSWFGSVVFPGIRPEFVHFFWFPLVTDNDRFLRRVLPFSLVSKRSRSCRNRTESPLVPLPSSSSLSTSGSVLSPVLPVTHGRFYKTHIGLTLFRGILFHLLTALV